MGIVRRGPPEELVLLLSNALRISIFVETGTFRGDTVKWAASHFKKVFTIENSEKLFQEVSSTYKHLKNVKFILGDSREVLASLLAEIHEPALFWLDAHWCGTDSWGADDECPLIQELEIILSARIDHFILIDDARLFLSPPPLPHVVEQWPTIDVVCRTVYSKRSEYYLVVFEDVIVAVPNVARLLVAEYCQAANTEAWEKLGYHGARNGFDLIKRGLILITRDALYKFKQVAGI